MLGSQDLFSCGQVLQFEDAKCLEAELSHFCAQLPLSEWKSSLKIINVVSFWGGLM